MLGRYRNHDDLDKYIEQWTSKHENYEVMVLLQRWVTIGMDFVPDGR
jgi:hypothetical protein